MNLRMARNDSARSVNPVVAECVEHPAGNPSRSAYEAPLLPRCEKARASVHQASTARAKKAAYRFGRVPRGVPKLARRLRNMVTSRYKTRRDWTGGRVT